MPKGHRISAQFDGGQRVEAVVVVVDVVDVVKYGPSSFGLASIK